MKLIIIHRIMQRYIASKDWAELFRVEIKYV